MRDFSRKYSGKFKSNLKSSSWTPWRHATTLLRSFFKKVNKLCFLSTQSHGNSTYETPSSNFSINISSTHWSNSVENLKVIAIKRKNDFIIRYGNNRLPPPPPADSISSKKNPRKVFQFEDSIGKKLSRLINSRQKYSLLLGWAHSVRLKKQIVE